jgi:hypothetical protein
MKREEFWLGVCVYLLIVLAGHFGPDLSKIPFLNEKISLFLSSSAPSSGKKINSVAEPKESLGSIIAMRAPLDLKETSHYAQPRPRKASSRFQLKGNGTPSKAQHPVRGPVQPIAFYL